MKGDNAFVLNYLKQNAYRSSNFAALTVRSAVAEDDEALTQLFTEVVHTPLMSVKLGRNSYLKTAALNYTRSDTKVIVSSADHTQIVAMFNIGWKYCFINEKSDVQRYLADIRTDPQADIDEILAVIIEYLEEYLTDDMLFQSVLLKNQSLYQANFYQRKKGLPYAYPYDDIYCYALTDVETPEHLHHYKIQTFKSDLITDIHDFFKLMSKHYNFLPQYNFAGLLQHQHPFWQNLDFKDFYVVYQHKQIVGFYGLWDQRHLKTMQVTAYCRGLKYFRPIYNLYMALLGKMRLPEQGQALDCLMLHSVLCHPQHLDVFSTILHHASQQTHRKRVAAFCLALASNDPRLTKIEENSTYKVAAKHIFHSFHLHPKQVFDRQKISFFELARL